MEQQTLKNNIFFKAVMDNDLKAVLFDLNNGFDIEAKDDSTGETALSIAAKFGYTEMVLMLLDKGADVDSHAAINDFNTPLMRAVSRLSNHAVIDALLERGADIEHCNYSNSTALLLAASAGNYYAAERLLVFGANVDAKNKYSCTAMIMAAENGNADIVALLLRGGANYSVKEDSGRTALEIAGDENHEAVVTVFKSFFENRELDKLIENQEEKDTDFKF